MAKMRATPRCIAVEQREIKGALDRGLGSAGTRHYEMPAHSDSLARVQRSTSTDPKL